MNIRPETENDIAAIQALTYTAFENHPHHAPGAKPTEHLIINQLRSNNALTLSLVAEENGNIIGHIAFSPVTINGQSLRWYGLGPMAVLPNTQSKGIGSQLIRKGLDVLESDGASGVVLLGDPAFYGRFGFNPHADLILPDVPPEYFMARSLNDQEIPKGKVVYDEAFSVTE